MTTYYKTGIFETSLDMYRNSFSSEEFNLLKPLELVKINCCFAEITSQQFT